MILSPGAGLLLLLFPLPLQEEVEAEDAWEVDAPHGPEFTFEHEATEGTWISVDVAPDGSTLVFDLLGHLYELPIEGGEAVALTEGRSWNMFPRYSPDGSRIAFTSDRGGSNDLWVLDRETGELEDVSKMKLPVFQGTWSADGSALYGTALDLKVRFPAYRFNFHGTRQELLPAGERTPVNHLQEHPSGDFIYYVHNDGSLPTSGPKIKRFDRRTGEVEVYVDRPGGAAAAALSPDGTRMAYVHREDTETVLVLHELGSESERVLLRGLDRGRLESRSFYGCYPNLSWHPEGREVLLSMKGGIHAVDVESGDAREIPFRATYTRPMTETARFPVEVPREETRVLSYRWSQPAGDAVLFEALGDLWRKQGDEFRNLTNSPDHETCPVLDAPRDRIVYASWNDEERGSVWALELATGERTKLSTEGRQHGSIAVSPDGAVAYLRGTAESVRRGIRIERQTEFELVLYRPGAGEEVVTDVEWTSNRYGKRPPTIRFAPETDELYFTEYVDDALTLKCIDTAGKDERTIATFPHATRAVVSPDFRWIALREYHRTFVTPFEFVGKPLKVSARDGLGFTQRVERYGDGDFTEWSDDGSFLYWTRGPKHCRKSLEAILAKEEDAVEAVDLSFSLEVDRHDATIAMTGVRVLTMNAEKDVLENATLVVEGDHIAALGTDVPIPADAIVLDLSGRTVMPGMFDAHGHYGSPISALNVIEQRLYGLHANLAYGVTTMFDVYGTTQKDFWVSDMLRSGKIIGPRIYSVGDTIFVTKYRTKMYRPIDSLDDAREVARFNQEHGATALKDYSNHTRAARQQLAVACREQGLNLVTESFSDPQMNLTQLADGFTGIEHTMGLAPLYEDVLSMFAATEVGMTPTLIVVYNGTSGERYFQMRERLWEDPKLLNFFRADALLRHRRPQHIFDDDFYHMEMAAELTKLYRRGVPLHMGAHGQLMGLGAHWEVEMFVHGGFTPYEALEIATIHGFRHHGLDGDLGSLEVGKLADLVVLTANPLEDIQNTRSIESVMKNGRLYDGFDASPTVPERREQGPLYYLAR